VKSETSIENKRNELMYAHRFAGLAVVSVSITLAYSLLLIPGSTALADPILPGFDLLHTPPGGGMLPHPMGGPPIILQGRPIGPGNTDTIVERLGGLPDLGTGNINIELVALSLESVAPTQIGTSFFDVFVDLNPAASSLGQITVTSHPPGPGGGTFDSALVVNSRITFTEVGNPSNTQVVLQTDLIESLGTLWSHIRPPGYPANSAYPSGGFYPGPIVHTGPHPNTVPASPEPSSAFLLVIGGLGIFGHWRQRK
jgi:hypothetical protein